MSSLRDFCDSLWLAQDVLFLFQLYDNLRSQSGLCYLHLTKCKCSILFFFFPSEIVSVACEKRTLSVFSACGRRLLPPIVLNTPISTLHCTGSYIMALTTAATLSVW